MKKILFTILLSTVTTLCKSQPVLNSNEMLSVNSVMHFKYILNYNVVDTNIQGANVTWNFQSLQNSTQPDLYVTIANPASTPYSSNFPSANYAYSESPAIAYRYFSLTSTKMERVGSWSGSINTFNDPQTEYAFPMMMGTSNLDTWDNTNSSFGGNYNLFGVGYGTLALPGNFYNNALMMRVDFDETFYSMPIYFWYSSDNGALLLEYSPGDGTFVPEFGLFISQLTLGINDNDFVYDMRYNNPVENTLSLNFQSKLNDRFTFQVINTLGETVLREVHAVNSGHFQNLQFNFSSLAKGIYNLNIVSESNGQPIRSIKLIKQ